MRFFLCILACALAQAPAAEPVYVGTYVWKSDDPAFGGFSGIDLSDDGSSFHAITDKGNLVVGQFVREADQITNVAYGPFYALWGWEDGPLRAGFNDSEGLAVAPSGQISVSFEGHAKIRQYAFPGSPVHALEPHPDFRRMQSNSSLEALAIDKNGWLYTLPERSGRANISFQTYVFKGEIWERDFQIARRGPFLPVGADVGPDDKFYLLERDFTGIGFRSRVRRFALDGSNEETILQTGNATHDNLEGIAVWRDGSGDLRLTMIADDNFRWFQQTEIVEYRLTD